MDLWTFLAVCGVAAIVSEMYRAKLKARVKIAESAGQLGDLEARLEKIEERLTNLETLVIEREKHKEFDRALK